MGRRGENQPDRHPKDANIAQNDPRSASHAFRPGPGGGPGGPCGGPLPGGAIGVDGIGTGRWTASAKASVLCAASTSHADADPGSGPGSWMGVCGESCDPAAKLAQIHSPSVPLSDGVSSTRNESRERRNEGRSSESDLQCPSRDEASMAAGV
jgi:hypothetical protein